MIDEIPLVAMLAAFADGTTVIRNAVELRVKESDRLAAMAHNLEAMGVSCGVMEDGLVIEGKAEPAGTDFSSFRDHRIAMACAVGALAAAGPSSIDDDTVVNISCPGFFDLLDKIRA
jgi:3-phosphoshikimate 1-carboxyvinyltransferase